MSVVAWEKGLRQEESEGKDTNRDSFGVSGKALALLKVPSRKG